MRSLLSFKAISHFLIYSMQDVKQNVFEIIIETIILQETCNFLESTIVYFFKVKTLKYILIKLDEEKRNTFNMAKFI